MNKSVHMARKGGNADSAFNHQIVHDLLPQPRDDDSDDDIPETKDQYFEFSDAYTIMRAIRLIIFVQIVALMIDHPSMRIAHLFDIFCRGVLFYSMHFYSRPFIDALYLIQLFWDKIKNAITSEGGRLPSGVVINTPGRRLNSNPYIHDGMQTVPTRAMGWSVDLLSDANWHTLKFYAHYFLGLLFILLAVLFAFRFWELKDYSDRDGVKKWLHNYVSDGWWRRGGLGVAVSTAGVCAIIAALLIFLNTLTSSVAADSVSNGLILSTVGAVGLSVVGIVWAMAVMWIRVTEQSFLRYVSQNVAYTSVIILKRAVKAKFDMALALLVALFLPVTYTLLQAQLLFTDWNETLAPKFRSATNFYVPCYFAAFPPYMEKRLDPETCPVASYSSPKQQLSGDGLYSIQNILPCDTYMGVAMHVLSTGLFVYIVVAYFYIFTQLIHQVVGEFNESKWVDVLLKLIRIREDEVLDYGERFTVLSRWEVALRDELGKQASNLHISVLWLLDTAAFVVSVVVRNGLRPVMFVLEPLRYVLLRGVVMIYLCFSKSPSKQRQLRKSFALKSTPASPVRRRSSMFGAFGGSAARAQASEALDSEGSSSPTRRLSRSTRASMLKAARASVSVGGGSPHGNTRASFVGDLSFFAETASFKDQSHSEKDPDQSSGKSGRLWPGSVSAKRVDVLMKRFDVFKMAFDWAAGWSMWFRKTVLRSHLAVYLKLRYHMLRSQLMQQKREDGSMMNGIASLGGAYAPWRKELTLQSKTTLISKMQDHVTAELRLAKRCFVSEHELVIGTLDYVLDTAGMMTLCTPYAFDRMYWFLLVLAEVCCYVLVGGISKQLVTWADRNVTILVIDVIFGLITYVFNPYTEELDRWLDFTGRGMVFCIAVGLIWCAQLSDDPNNAVPTHMYDPWRNAPYLTDLLAHPHLSLYTFLDVLMVLYFYAYVVYNLSIMGVFGWLDRVLMSVVFRGHDNVLDFLVFISEARTFGMENLHTGLLLLQQWDDVIKSQRRYALLTSPDIRPPSLVPWRYKVFEVKWASLFNLTLDNLRSSLGLTILHTTMFNGQCDAVRWIIYSNPALLTVADSQNDNPVTIVLKECAYYLYVYGEQEGGALDDGTTYSDESYAEYYPEVDALRDEIHAEGEFVAEYVTVDLLSAEDLLLLRDRGYYRAPKELDEETLLVMVAEEKTLKNQQPVVFTASQRLDKHRARKKEQAQRARQRVRRTNLEKLSIFAKRFPEDDRLESPEQGVMQAWEIVGLQVSQDQLAADPALVRYMKAHNHYHYNNFETLVHQDDILRDEDDEGDVEAGRGRLLRDRLDHLALGADKDIQYVVPSNHKVHAAPAPAVVPLEHGKVRALADWDHVGLTRRKKPRPAGADSDDSDSEASSRLPVGESPSNRVSFLSPAAVLTIFSPQERVDLEVNAKWNITKFAEILLSSEMVAAQHLITWTVSDFKALAKIASVHQGKIAQHLAFVCHFNAPDGFVRISDWSTNVGQEVFYEKPDDTVNLFVKTIVTVLTNAEKVAAGAVQAVQTVGSAVSAPRRSWKSGRTSFSSRRAPIARRMTSRSSASRPAASIKSRAGDDDADDDPDGAAHASMAGEVGMLSDRVVHYLAECLVSSREALVLDDCELANNGRRGWRAICRALRRRFSSFVLPSLCTPPKPILLRVLKLPRNELDCGDAVYITDILTHQPLLETVDLSFNHIGSRGAMRMCKALRTHKHVLSWDLSHNTVGPAAGKDFGLLLKASRTLLHLNLAHNQLGEIHRFPTLLSRESIPSAAHDLCVGLRSNRSLQQLDLSYNHLGPSLAEALPVAVMKHPRLHTLDISGNDLGPDKGALLLFALAGQPRGAEYAKERDRFIADVRQSQINKANDAQAQSQELAQLALRELEQQEARAFDQTGHQEDYSRYANLEMQSGSQLLDSESAIFGQNPFAAQLPPPGSPAKDDKPARRRKKTRGDDDSLSVTSSIAKAPQQLPSSPGRPPPGLAGEDPVGLVSTGLQRERSIEDSLAEAFAASMRRVTKPASGLTALSCADNQLGPFSGHAVASLLWRIKGLTHLDVSGNALGPVGGERVADQLELLHRVVPREFLKRVLYEIEESKFADTQRNPKKRKKLFTNLISLGLARNNLGPKVMASLMVTLATPQCGIVHLDVSLNPVGLTQSTLSGNAFEAAADIRHGLQANKSLTRLLLDHTQFACTDLVTLFGGMAAHPFLQHLSLQGARMDEPAALQLSNVLLRVATLTHIDLRDCGLGPNGGVILAQKLKLMMTRVRLLDLGGNNLGPIPAIMLAEGLAAAAQRCSLHTLRFGGNDCLEEGGAALAKALVGNLSVTEVDLSGNVLAPSNAKDLADAVRGLFRNGVKVRDSVIRTLLLNDNPLLGARAGRAIVRALANNIVQHLELRNVGLGPGSGELLGQFLRDPFVAWQYVDVSRNGLTRLGLNAIFWAMRQNKRVRVLRASEGRAGTLFCSEADALLDHGIAVPKALAANSVLRELDLSFNSITSDGGVRVLDAMLDNFTIKRLSLRGNLLDDMVATRLSALLDGNDVLEELDLGRNRMGFTCLFEVSTALATNRRMRALLLDNNSFGGAGVGTLDAFTRAVMMNYSLKVLNLDGNKLGPEWGLRMGETLARNNTLVQVSLRNNRFDARAGVALLNAYRFCKYLLELALSADEIGVDLWEDFRALFLEKRACVDPNTLREETELSDSQSQLLQGYH